MTDSLTKIEQQIEAGAGLDDVRLMQWNVLVVAVDADRKTFNQSAYDTAVELGCSDALAVHVQNHLERKDELRKMEPLELSKLLSDALNIDLAHAGHLAAFAVR